MCRMQLINGIISRVMQIAGTDMKKWMYIAANAVCRHPSYK